VASRSVSFASTGRLIPVNTGLPRVASRFGRLGTVSVARKSRSAAALVKRRTVGSIRCLRSARTLPVSVIASVIGPVLTSSISDSTS